MKLQFKKPKLNSTHGIARLWIAFTQDFINPLREWTVGLALGVTFFVLGVLYVGLDFYIQFGLPPTETPTDASPIVYREREVRVVADTYREKARIYNELRTRQQYVAPIVEPPENATTTEAGAEETTPLADDTEGE